MTEHSPLNLVFHHQLQYAFAGGTDCKFHVDTELLVHAMEEYRYAGNLLVDEDYAESDALCADFNRSYPPTTYTEALELYFLLIDDCSCI